MCFFPIKLSWYSLSIILILHVLNAMSSTIVHPNTFCDFITLLQRFASRGGLKYHSRKCMTGSGQEQLGDTTCATSSRQSYSDTVTPTTPEEQCPNNTRATSIAKPGEQASPTYPEVTVVKEEDVYGGGLY